MEVIDLAPVQAACPSLPFLLSTLLLTSSHFTSQHPSQERWLLPLQVNALGSLSEV